MPFTSTWCTFNILDSPQVVHTCAILSLGSQNSTFILYIIGMMSYPVLIFTESKKTRQAHKLAILTFKLVKKQCCMGPHRTCAHQTVSEPRQNGTGLERRRPFFIFVYYSIVTGMMKIASNQTELSWAKTRMHPHQTVIGRMWNKLQSARSWISLHRTEPSPAKLYLLLRNRTCVWVTPSLQVETRLLLSLYLFIAILSSTAFL